MIGCSASSSRRQRLAGIGAPGQRVAGRHDDRVVPLVEREGHECGMAFQRLGRDRDVGLAGLQQRDDLGRAGLVQHQVHARKGLLEAPHHLGQRVARLGVRGGDHQAAAVAVGELLGDALDVAGVDQHALDDRDQLPARLGQPEQALAAAHEQLDAELVLEILDVLADARLRGVQRIGDLGQVEVLRDRLADDAQLLEVHRPSSGGMAPRIGEHAQARR